MLNLCSGGVQFDALEDMMALGALLLDILALGLNEF